MPIACSGWCRLALIHACALLPALTGMGPLRAQEPATGGPAAEQSQEAPEDEAHEEEAPEAAPSPWAGTVELYGFTPLRSSGTTTVRGFDADFDLDLGDILSALDGAFYLRGSVERERWGILTDLSYVRLGDKKASTSARGNFTGNARLAFEQGVYDLAVRYRFGDRESAVAKPGDWTVIPYLGVRVIDLEQEVKAEVRSRVLRGNSLQKQGSLERTWAQPLVGLQASTFLSPRLRAFARADIGGFGLSGDEDLSGNVQLGLGYAIGENTDLNLSWRYQGIRYQNDRTPGSGVNVDNNGIELGVKVFF
ncbi:MAG: hypothetical protein AAFX65_05155 [Cyanobacteria bacterium J06638_7]